MKNFMATKSPPLTLAEELAIDDELRIQQVMDEPFTPLTDEERAKMDEPDPDDEPDEDEPDEDEL